MKIIVYNKCFEKNIIVLYNTRILAYKKIAQNNVSMKLCVLEKISQQKGGGADMVEETIRTIREAEKQADEIVKRAEEESGSILAEAKEKASALKEEAVQKARESAAAVTAEAQTKAAEAGEKDEQELSAEISKLKDAALKREAEAVDLVISQAV